MYTSAYNCVCKQHKLAHISAHISYPLHYRLHVSGYNPSISTAGNNIYKYRLHVLGYNPNISTTGNTNYKYRLHVHGYNPNISTAGILLKHHGSIFPQRVKPCLKYCKTRVKPDCT